MTFLLQEITVSKSLIFQFIKKIMKIAIVTSSDLIFRKIGNDLSNKIVKFDKIDIFCEKQNISFFKILKYRFKKFGFFKSQNLGFLKFIY